MRHANKLFGLSTCLAVSIGITLNESCEISALCEHNHVDCILMCVVQCTCLPNHRVLRTYIP